jgi:chromosome segregation ATPase
VADLNHIRDRLAGIRHEAEKQREKWRQPVPERNSTRPHPSQPSLSAEAERERRRRLQIEAELDVVEAQRREVARQNAVLADECERLQASSEERLRLERALAEADLTAEQAQVALDRARAELEATKAELVQTRAELEAARHERESSAAAADTKGSQRKHAKLRAEKRIAALEGELESERELRRDLEHALQLLQDQRREDAGAASQGHDDDRTKETTPGETSFAQPAPTQTAPAPTAPAREPGPVTPGPEPDGWGVPLEAFPVDAEPPPDAPKNSGRGARPGRRLRALPRGRAER